MVRHCPVVRHAVPTKAWVSTTTTTTRVEKKRNGRKKNIVGGELCVWRIMNVAYLSSPMGDDDDDDWVVVTTNVDAEANTEVKNRFNLSKLFWRREMHDGGEVVGSVDASPFLRPMDWMSSFDDCEMVPVPFGQKDAAKVHDAKFTSVAVVMQTRFDEEVTHPANRERLQEFLGKMETDSLTVEGSDGERTYATGVRVRTVCADGSEYEITHGRRVYRFVTTPHVSYVARESWEDGRPKRRALCFFGWTLAVFVDEDRKVHLSGIQVVLPATAKPNADKKFNEVVFDTLLLNRPRWIVEDDSDVRRVDIWGECLGGFRVHPNHLEELTFPVRETVMNAFYGQGMDSLVDCMQTRATSKFVPWALEGAESTRFYVSWKLNGTSVNGVLSYYTEANAVLYNVNDTKPLPLTGAHPKIEVCATKDAKKAPAPPPTTKFVSIDDDSPCLLPRQKLTVWYKPGEVVVTCTDEEGHVQVHRPTHNLDKKRQNSGRHSHCAVFMNPRKPEDPLPESFDPTGWTEAEDLDAVWRAVFCDEVGAVGEEDIKKYQEALIASVLGREKVMKDEIAKTQKWLEPIVKQCLANV